MEVVVTTGAIGRAKLQSNHHHRQTNTHFLQAGCPWCATCIVVILGQWHLQQSNKQQYADLPLASGRL